MDKIDDDKKVKTFSPRYVMPPQDALSYIVNGDPMPPELIEFILEAANGFEQYADLSPDPHRMRYISGNIRETLDYFRMLEGMNDKHHSHSDT